MERIVVVGAGQAGVQAVASLRAEGFAGEIALLGDEPFPPYQRPPLSKAYLSGEFVRERLFLKPDSFYAESACELRLATRVKAIDRAAKKTEFEDGSALAYDKLILTTGARVRRLPVPGDRLEGVHYLRGIADVDAIRPRLKQGTRLAVVGGGYIGLEVAAVAVKLGAEVSVIEAANRVMVRAVTPQLSAYYERTHRAHGVKLLLGATAEAFLGNSQVDAVKTNLGTVPADLVLVGIGIVPNCELAQKAGLACDNGIMVDEFGATSDPGIFAAGDCTSHPDFYGARVRLESVQNAIDQARHVALSVIGKPSPYREVPWFWSDQYDLKLQIAGLARPSDVVVPRGDPVTGKFAVFHLRDGVVVAVEAVNSAPDYIIGRRLIAARAHVAAEKLADMRLPIKSFF
jgi:3-phenylpropionate/trans-cinnamate dioxygenase ferredoxin reductase subunit